MQVFNQAAHEHLVAQGYLFSYHPADFDDGDSENGPGSWGHDAYNCYSGTDENVYVATDGTAGHEAVDPELENWRRDQDYNPKHSDDPQPFFYTVAIYLVDRRYGGPEEGGWYYDTGSRIDDPTEHGCFDVPALYKGSEREKALEFCGLVNDRLITGANKGRPCVSSVLSRGRYQAQVHEGYPQAYYPTERPHYE